MSAPFNTTRRHQWMGPVRFPNGHDFTKWRGPKDAHCETKPDAADRRDAAVRSLANGTCKQAILSKVYEVCWDDEPCCHQLEPLCARRLRINFVGRASKAIATHCSGKPQWWVTLVPKKGKVAPADLHKFSLLKFRDYVARKISAAALDGVCVIGAVDISYNVSSEKEWRPHWQFHVHCVMTGGDKPFIERKLKKVFKRSGPILRPVTVKPITDLMGALGYSCKAFFERRVSYLDDEGNYNTRKGLGLKPNEFREISEFMAAQSVSSRFLLRGFRRRGRKLEPT